MTCKDCVHYEVCLDDYSACGVHFVEAKDCIHFKPKSRFVEVVRCKDCEHYKEYSKIEDFDGQCIVRECETDRTEFCSYGKRALKERNKNESI